MSAVGMLWNDPVLEIDWLDTDAIVGDSCFAGEVASVPVDTSGASVTFASFGTALLPLLLFEL